MATETELISYPEPAPEQAHEMCESIMSGESAGFFAEINFPLSTMLCTFFLGGSMLAWF